MDYLEEYNSPSDTKFYEVVNVHNVTNSERKTLASWRESIIVLVGENEVEYALDVHYQDEENHATFLFYDNFNDYKNEVEVNNMRDHYVIKVLFVDAFIGQEIINGDNNKLFEMTHIMVAKRRYQLL